MDNKPNTLLGLSLDELTQAALNLGLPKFVGKQLADWLYKKQVRSIEQMTNLSKEARRRLAERYQIGISTPVESALSKATTSRPSSSPTASAPRSASPPKWAAKWPATSA